MGLTPSWRIDVGAEDLTGSLAGRVAEIRVTSETEQESDALELVVVDATVGSPSDRRPVRVWMGYGQALAWVGSYFIETVEIGLTPPRSITVSATAVDMRAGSSLKAPHTHTWSETTLGAVIRTIAEEHALEPHVSPEIADVQIDHIDQAGESDLALLQRLAREYGCVVKVAAGRLIAMSPGAGAAPGSGLELPVRTVAPGDVVRGRASLHGRPRYGAVQVFYQDTDVGPPRLVQAGAGDPVFAVRGRQPDAVAAASIARAKYRELASRAASLKLTLPGDPLLMAESPLRMSGWGRDVDGRWVVRRARHVLTPGAGFTTEIEAAAISPPTIPTRTI